MASCSEPQTVGTLASSAGGRSYRFLSMAGPGWILFRIPSSMAMSRDARAPSRDARARGRTCDARRMLAPGQPAPPFCLPAHDGTTVELAALRGQRVLVWFYPEADTPG